VKYLSKPRGSFLKSGTQEIRNFVFEKTEIGRCRDNNNTYLTAESTEIAEFFREIYSLRPQRSQR
jgi:hypothetical protein